MPTHCNERYLHRQPLYSRHPPWAAPRPAPPIVWRWATCRGVSFKWVAQRPRNRHIQLCVDWHAASEYCEWAGARLPTEAEWEYAFRGEQGSIYPWGDSFDGAKLNYCDVNCDLAHGDDRYDDGYSRTAPVESYPEGASWCDALGMSGNVSEWVADWLSDYSPKAESNPIGPSSGNEKIVRGCSWFFHPAYCRGAMRASISPDVRFDYVGFRCVVPITPF